MYKYGIERNLNVDINYNRIYNFFIDRVNMPHDLTLCWEWKNKGDKNNYGILKFNKRTYRAHRISYLLFKGVPGELLVCHKCDNPKCVNPDHLFLGTPEDNLKDASAKGRLLNSEERKKARSKLYFGKGNPFYGKKHTEETKAILAIKCKRIFSEEERKKASERMKGKRHGKNHPLFGKPVSQETRNKISLAGRGRKHTEKTKKLISESNIGKKHSEEAKLKMSQAGQMKHNGEKNGRSKLKIEDVIKIREAIKTEAKLNNIAHLYNVSKSTIKNIKNNKTWRYDV